MGGYRQLSLGWQICSTRPGECQGPTSLFSAPRLWIPAIAPSTVASSLRAAGLWSLTSTARQFDDEDWWFHLPFSVDETDLHDDVVFGFDGLATIAEVWLNGERLLSSANMFIAHECPVGRLPAVKNELVICFRALTSHLKLKRARPAWRAPMVADQQLRWVRTTLLGRTPGWSPPAAAVGPWRSVWLRTGHRICIEIVPQWWTEVPVQRWVTRRSTMLMTPTQALTVDYRNERLGPSALQRDDDLPRRLRLLAGRQGGRGGAR